MLKLNALTYAPDSDSSWNVAPGTLTSVTNLAPTSRGSYVSASTVDVFGFDAMASTAKIAYILRNVAGNGRFLAFNSTTIDEYAQDGTRTNRATGLVAADDWTATTMGDAIIACSYTNSSLVSSGGAFTAGLTGAPKARLCATQLGFVMLADYDDGVNQYRDGWWTSSQYDPFTYTPNSVTMAGNARLLDTPGPITALVAFKDNFIAFKNDSMYVASFSGPPDPWQWRLVSNTIGCVGKHAVTQLGGVLYFVHTTGIWAYDGANFRNVGLNKINRQLLNETNYMPDVWDVLPNTTGDLSATHLIADDVSGSVIVLPRTGGAGAYRYLPFVYNAISDKWGRFRIATGAQDDYAVVRASIADIRSFFTNRFTCSALFVGTNGVSNKTVRAVWPSATVIASSLTTGLVGVVDESTASRGWYWRQIDHSDDDVTPTVTVNGYTTEDKNQTNGTATASINTELRKADYTLNAKFHELTQSWTVGKTTEIAGAAFDMASGGKRA